MAKISGAMSEQSASKEQFSFSSFPSSAPQNNQRSYFMSIHYAVICTLEETRFLTFCYNINIIKCHAINHIPIHLQDSATHVPRNLKKVSMWPWTSEWCLSRQRYCMSNTTMAFMNVATLTSAVRAEIHKNQHHGQCPRLDCCNQLLKQGTNANCKEFQNKACFNSRSKNRLFDNQTLRIDWMSA